MLGNRGLKGQQISAHVGKSRPERAIRLQPRATPWVEMYVTIRPEGA